ncbi:DHA2 family efflux MFS transporter permease subunit [Luedemannella flava]|uniref:DHA2 family efflux MFS transporter permease subunit n=1 Tax=Luedemannella flava TaxID=349316 RepID=A0ABP4XS57_9ACTN
MTVHPPRSRGLALAVLCAMQLMIILDGNVVALALPAIQSDLDLSPNALAWVVNAYLIPFGLLLLPAGRLGDVFGRRRVFLIGLAVFTAASLACGLATSALALLASRVVQGAGGAVASAVILGMIVTAYPGPGEQARALGIFSFVSAAGASIGLLGGGVVTSTLGWPWTFLVNVPIGLAALVLAPYVVPVVAGSRARRRTRLRVAWRPHVTAALIFAAGFGFQFTTALYLQNVLGYSAMSAGLAFLPTPIVIGAVSLWVAPGLVARFGARPVLVAGLGLFAAGIGLLSRAPVDGSYTVDLLPVFLVAGLGFGVAMPAVTMLAMANATPDNAGFASGVVNTVQQAGAVAGLATLTAIAAARTRGVLADGVDVTAALRDGYGLAAAVAAGFLLVGLVVTASARRRQAASVEDGAGDVDGHVRAAGMPEQATHARTPGEDQTVARAGAHEVL